MKPRPTDFVPAPKLSRRDSLRILGYMGATAILAPALRAGTDAARPAGRSLAGQQPGFYRFRIGEIEAIALNDGGFEVAPTESPWSGHGQADALPAILGEALLPVDRVCIPFGVLLVRLGAELILVDTGCGKSFGPEGGRLVDHLTAAGVSPDEVTAVIISHLHYDHFGGLLDPHGAPNFRNAVLFIHADEYDFWTGSSPVGVSPRSVAKVQEYVRAFSGKWQRIRGGEKLLDGIEIIDAHGHTPGHLALLIGSGKDQLLHCVDTVHHHAISFRHPEFVNAFDVQPDQAVRTRQALLDRMAADRLRVFGAHLPFPSLGHVRRTGGAYEYLIEPWSMG